jgi:hypothetical protein
MAFEPSNCGPSGIFEALINAGFTVNQAIGAMANAINESNLDPETPAGDGGTSFGLWQFHNTSYPDAPHPTGNCKYDIVQAVGYLKTHVSGAALAGSTPGEVAGNFAANFENCQGCQPGGAQYSQRVANAATVAGWVTSGKWPAGSVGPGGGGNPGIGNAPSTPGGTPSGNAPPASQYSRAACAANLSIPLLGDFCLLSKAQARGLVGGLLMFGGALLTLPGLIVLVAAGFRGSGAAQVAGKAAEAIPVIRLTTREATRAGGATSRAAGGQGKLERAETPAEIRARQRRVTQATTAGPLQFRR